MAQTYLPYRISYRENGHEVSLKAPHRKRAVSLARPLVRKGFSITGEEFSNQHGTWLKDADLQALINALPKSANPRVSKGSTEAYNALQALAACASSLAVVAMKRPLSDEENMDLLECMEEVESVLGLSSNETPTPEDNDPEHD